ncbi:hypothetical protein R1sor_013442 [Riccia sorocarpa]|uniref:DNA-3-methyladenine glycosylase II n=1 Tax=Riccia sorocarpa TaxID=122646 RepID=A0ABD3H6N6_9MARC
MLARFTSTITVANVWKKPFPVRADSITRESGVSITIGCRVERKNSVNLCVPKLSVQSWRCSTFSRDGRARRQSASSDIWAPVLTLGKGRSASRPMTKSPAVTGLKAAGSSTVRANSVIDRVGEQRRSLRLQHLAQFALTDSQRKSVSSSLRKRTQKSDIDGDSDVGAAKVVKIDKSESSTKVRSVSGRKSFSRNVNSEQSLDFIPRSNLEISARLDASFFQCDALELAPKLLGKLLRRDDVIIRITEVEAYRPNDTACHARVGITPRTEPLFGPAGHAYVYLCYGIHYMLNVVAGQVGVGTACLIRSCCPVAGLKTIQERRGLVTEKPVLLTGPGKVGQALGLTTDWCNHPMYLPGGLEILDSPLPEKILIGPRVGIDYADPKDIAAEWRFAVADTRWVSAPRSTLRPMPNG